MILLIRLAGCSLIAVAIVGILWEMMPWSGDNVADDRSGETRRAESAEL